MSVWEKLREKYYPNMNDKEFEKKSELKAKRKRKRKREQWHREFQKEIDLHTKLGTERFENFKPYNCEFCGRSIKAYVRRACPYCRIPIDKDVNNCPYCKRLIKGSDFIICPYCRTLIKKGVDKKK